METKVKFLILGISMLLVGFIVLLFLAYHNPTLVNFGVFAFFMGVFATFGSLVEIATDKKFLQLNKKRIVGVALIVIAVGLAVPYSAWIIVVPNWSFSVSTDKSTYSLGENVEITVVVRNMGFITHSFKSELSDAIFINCWYIAGFSQVWYSPYYLEDTVFSLGPNQILQRDFVWNLTNIHQPEKEIEPGRYRITASVTIDYLSTAWEYVESPFWARTYISITST